jgi:hypothetical protein
VSHAGLRPNARHESPQATGLAVAYVFASMFDDFFFRHKTSPGSFADRYGQKQVPRPCRVLLLVRDRAPQAALVVKISSGNRMRELKDGLLVMIPTHNPTPFSSNLCQPLTSFLHLLVGDTIVWM